MKTHTHALFFGMDGRVSAYRTHLPPSPVVVWTKMYVLALYGRGGEFGTPPEKVEHKDKKKKNAQTHSQRVFLKACVVSGKLPLSFLLTMCMYRPALPRCHVRTGHSHAEPEPDPHARPRQKTPIAARFVGLATWGCRGRGAWTYTCQRTTHTSPIPTSTNTPKTHSISPIPLTTDRQ